MLIADRVNNIMYFQDTGANGEKHNEEVCPYFEVTRLIKKLPESLELPDEYEIYFATGNNEKTFRISTEDIFDNVQMAKIFGRNHFFVKRNCLYLVIDEITEQAQKVDNENRYAYENKCLGWLEVENRNVFLYDNRLINGHQCNCIRRCGKFRNGDEKKYDEMLNKNVLDNTPMSLAYVLGFAGVLISRLTDLRDLGSLIVGITGISSKGKTTALKLIASIWGNPNDINGTMILKNTGSEIGFQTQQAGLFGIPALFDDLDTNSKIDIGNFIYNMSKGSQRVIAKNNGDADFSRMGFSGISIITGENPLLSKTDQRMGLCVRVLDFSDLIVAKNGDSATEIKECICNNYGFKGKIFGEYIETISDTTLLEMFDKCNEEVLLKIKQKDSFTNRVSKNYAIIMLTTKLVNQCFGLNISVDKIIDLALISETEQIENRNKGYNSYMALLQYFYNNQSSFDIKKNNKVVSFASTGRLGIAYYSDRELQLKIPIATVKQILTSLGFPQIQSYKKDWKAKGYSRCEEGRFDKSNQELSRHYELIYILEEGE